MSDMTLPHSTSDNDALNELVFTAASEGIMVFESVHYTPDVITDLLIVDVNPAALKIAGRTREELVGKRLSAAFPGNFQNGLFERYRAALGTGKTESFEIHYPYDGLDSWFKVSASPVSATMLLITFVDISDIKKSEHLLARREAELRFILDAMPSRVWYKDDENGIIRLNKSAADAMGMTVEEAEGANTYDLFPAMAADYHNDDLIALDGEKPLLGIVERFTPKDGEQGWLTTDKIPFADPETKNRRLLVVSTDISRQKIAEDELRLANESLSHLASIAGRDLQSPLNQISVMAGQLSDELVDDDSNANTRQIIDHIQTTSGRLRQLATRLLEFSKAGAGEVAFERVDLNAVIAAALADSGAGSADHASVTVALGDADHVLGDSDLLTQVFANLFQNALQFGAKDHLELSVTAQLVKGLTTIQVKNSGASIKPEFAERIFEVISLLPHTCPDQGAGIGLTFCRKVVIRHGGSICLDQDNPSGTCFTLTLIPAFEAAPTSEPADHHHQQIHSVDGGHINTISPVKNVA